MSAKPFTAAELEKLAAGALRSAGRVVPLVMDLVRPRSVVDVGCGLGSWLSVFRRYGVEDFLGIDGVEVEGGELAIPPHRFRGRDLSEPLEVDRRFDLVVCLEVAEHLPLERGRALVESLTRLGPIVLFSAAIPGQGGSGHVNERWPDYWVGCFAEFGYRPVDCIRDAIWDDSEVEFWYRQNALLYVDPGELPRLGSALAGACSAAGRVRPLVHPALYEKTRWLRRAEAANRELLELLLVSGQGCGGRRGSPGKILLLDHAQLDLRLPTACGWELVTFPQSDGLFSGPPAHEDEAIRELQRWRASGAELFVIAWPAYWWLEVYAAFAAHLDTYYPRRIGTENIQVFDLGSPGSCAP